MPVTDNTAMLIFEIAKNHLDGEAITDFINKKIEVATGKPDQSPHIH